MKENKMYLTVYEYFKYILPRSIFEFIIVVILPLVISMETYNLFTGNNINPIRRFSIIFLCLFAFGYFLYKRRETYIKLKKHEDEIKELAKLQKDFNNIRTQLERAENSITLYDNLITNIHSTMDKEYEMNNKNSLINTFTTKIFNKKIYNKEHYIKNILKSLCQFVCVDAEIPIIPPLVNFFNVDASVTLLYKKIDNNIRNKKIIPNEHWLRGWEMLDFGYQSELTVKDFISERTSAANCLFFKSQTGKIFWHDKENDSIINGVQNYRMHPRDHQAFEETKEYGSFFGYKFDVINSNDEIGIVAMLFISTFGVKICKSEERSEKDIVKNNYETIVFPMYINFLQKELIKLIK